MGEDKNDSRPGHAPEPENTIDPDLTQAGDAGTPTPSGPVVHRLDTNAETWAGQPDAARSDSFPKIPGYEIRRVLGEGGMGRVYEAVHEPLGRSVALKVLRGGHRTPEMIDRFMKEMRVLAHIEHVGIARVFDAGTYEVDGDVLPFFVMEYVAGARELGLYFTHEDVDLSGRLDTFARVCEAVAYLHRKQIVHRDLKPENILIGADGQPKVIDFGVAKLLGPMLIDDADSAVTAPGAVPGTPMYMSPEQVAGEHERIGPASDVYSLGVAFYKMLTGMLPYRMETGRSTLAETMICNAPMVPATTRVPELPRSIDTVLSRALQRDPADRYASALELAEDLRSVARGDAPEWAQRGTYARFVARTRRRVRTKPWLAAAIATVAAIVFAFAVVLPLRRAWQGPTKLWWAIASPIVTETPLRGVVSDTEEPLSSVRVAALDDDTLAEAQTLARAFGVGAFDQASPRDYRWLHTLVLQRLIAARPSVVAIDFYFWPDTDSRFDEDLEAALGALCGAGIPVVLGVDRWDLPGGLPYTHQGFFGACERMHWGVITLEAPPDRAWSVDVALLRDDDLARPGLALAALGAERPGDPTGESGGDLSGTLGYDIEVRGTENMVVLRRWREGVVRTGAGPAIRIKTSITPVQQAQPDLGIRAGDISGTTTVRVPGEPDLARATIGYAQILSMTDTELKDAFRGRAVFLGSTATAGPQVDRSPYIDGRSVPLVYAHAVAFDQMKRAVYIRVTSDRDVYISLFASATLGGLAACLWRGGRRNAVLLFVFTAVFYLGISLGFAVFASILDPTPMFTTGCAALGIGLLLVRRPRGAGA